MTRRALLLSLLFAVAACRRGASQSAELDLPAARTGEELPAPLHRVTVSRSQLAVDGKPVLGGLEERWKDLRHDLAIKELLQALPVDGGQLDAPIAIAADRSTPYRGMIEVVYTLGRFGYTQLQLAVRGDGPSGRAIPMTLPSMQRGKRLPRAIFTVAVNADGYRLLAGSEPHAPLARVAGQLDAAALSQAAQAALAAAPGEQRSAVVVADPTTPWHEVVATLDALRQTPDGKPLLSDLLLASGLDGGDRRAGPSQLLGPDPGQQRRRLVETLGRIPSPSVGAEPADPTPKQQPAPQR